MVGSEVEADEVGEREEEVGDWAGEEVVLEVEVAEGGEGGEVGGEWAGEGVEAEAEGVEVGQIGDGVGRELAREAHGGEAELGDGGGGGVAGDAGPETWGGFREVPEEGSASDGGAEGQEGCSVGGQVRFSGGEEEEEEEETEDMRVHFSRKVCLVFLSL